MTEENKYIPVPDGSTVKIRFDPATRDVLYVEVIKPGAKRLRELLYQIQHDRYVANPAEILKLTDEALDILAKMHPAKYAVNDRPITLGEWYDGHGPEDPPGRYYTFDDSPHVTHWMSTGAMKIRMKEIDQ